MEIKLKMLTQRVRVAESRIENSSANGPQRVRSKGWVLKRVLDVAGCNWVVPRAVAIEFTAVVVEFRRLLWSSGDCREVRVGCCGVYGGCYGVRVIVVEFVAVVVRFRGAFYVILCGFYAFWVTFCIVSCIIRVFRNVATCVKRQGYDSILKVHR